MPLAPQADVEAQIAPYASRLVAIVEGAWQAWRDAGHGYWRANRSRANFVWEEMVERAHQAFNGDPRVHIVGRNETFYFVLDQSVVFRFKKGDPSDLTCNIPTQTSLAFHDPQCELEGIGDTTRVDVLYVLNPLETAVVDVRVVARDGDRVAWRLSLMAPAPVVPMPMPMAMAEPQAPQAPARRSLVQAPAAGDTRRKQP